MLILLILIILGVCVGMHIWMMRKGHGLHHNDDDAHKNHAGDAATDKAAEDSKD